MNLDPLFQWVSNYGLGNFLSILIAVGAWKVLIYVLQENAKREERLASIIAADITGLANILRSRDSVYKEIESHIRRDEESHKASLEALEAIMMELKTR